MKPLKNLEELAVILDEMPHDDPSLEYGFDMNVSEMGVETVHPCGTAACIGGWVKHLNGIDRDSPLAFPEAAVRSIAPEMSDVCAYELCWNYYALRATTTPQQGAQAIRNSLAFADPKWDEVLGQ